MFALLDKRRWRALAAALVLMWAPITAAFAMRVSPMVVEMSSRGSDAVSRIEVQNVNPSNLAFETRIYRMTFDDKGEIIEAPADDMRRRPPGSSKATTRSATHPPRTRLE